MFNVGEQLFRWNTPRIIQCHAGIDQRRVRCDTKKEELKSGGHFYVEAKPRE